MSEVFIDTNVFIKIFNKESGYRETIDSLVEIRMGGWKFCVSCITHFEILWGFSFYGGDVDRYWKIISEFGIDIVPLTKEDVELASRFCKSKSKIRDFFIGATVVNRNGYLLTYNLSDFKWVDRVFTPEDFVKHMQ
jgi:predicted nucleic acid-binding protein